MCLDLGVINKYDCQILSDELAVGYISMLSQSVCGPE